MATTSETHRSSALLDHLARLSRARNEAALASFGLRPRHLVALTLLRDHGDATQQSLATTLQIDRTNLVGLLNDLESAGLVLRRRTDEDRRRHAVTLTGAGHARLCELEHALAAAEDDVFSALDDAQREALYRLLQQATAGHVMSCGAALAHAEQPGAC
jgi:DNA-binding MarR family transcriptional regulator